MTDEKRSYVTTLVFSIGLGLSLAWYYCCCRWLPGVQFVDAPIGYHVARIAAMVLVGAVGYRCFFSSKAFGRRKLLVAAGLLLCEASGAAVLFSGAAGANWIMSLLQGACLPMILMFWSCCYRPRSSKGAGIAVSAAFLFAGVLMALLSLLSVEIPYAPIVLPLLFGGCFFLSLYLDRRTTVQTTDCLKSTSPFRDKVLLLLVFCAALVGFVTGQYYCLLAPSATYSTYFGMYALAGVASLFALACSVRTSYYALSFMLLGSLVFVIVVLSLLLPDMGAAFAIIIGAMHWLCLLLLYAIAFQDEHLPSRGKAARAYVALGCFLVSGSLGGLAIVFLPELLVVGLIAGCSLVAVGFMLMRSSKRTFAHILGKPVDSPDECDSREHKLEVLARTRSLSARETEVFYLLAEGNTLKSIAERLYLSENTVKCHRRRIYQKFEVGSRQELLDLVRAA